ncbi:MAG: SAM-dependent methyltransferase [Paraglaciecola sp.]
MKPQQLGAKYDKIAAWWDKRHFNSDYGLKQVNKALSYSNSSNHALDVGCGAGGRFIHLLQKEGFKVTGLDVSNEMIKLARHNHPKEQFLVQDICTFESALKFDFILAWDSLFHLPIDMQKPVLGKLCNLLSPSGTLIYTFGDDEGEHKDQWRGDTFEYSSIGIKNNLQSLNENSMTCKHLELDQFPEKHVYIIATKDA